ncbi:MAG: ribosomal RNA small subunit methyltransferase A [Saprospiraceae bacterium]|nr:MAG: ribosomal RNA small subunit methyltransferase A [Saprospiraceae bacterium]
MRAKKSYGQHFLTNEAIAQRIAGSLTTVDGSPHSNVLEIGPGMGMLTKYLLGKDLNLLVVEADDDMVDYLYRNFIQLHGRVISQDFMKLNLENLFPSNSHSPIPNPQFCIIGNFPYNISSQIVFKMLENRHLVPELVGMFQKEMAERIVASPGSKDFGIISVLTQAHYSGELLFKVGNGNFNPPPKVQSAVIRLLRKDGDLGCGPELFRRVVKQAFSQRRKMLRNTLRPLVNDPGMLSEDFFRQRPEVLSVSDFVALTNRIGRLQ